MTQDLAKRPPELQPVGTMDAAREMIQSLDRAIQNLIPKGANLERWKSVMANVFQRQPDLLFCTRQSLEIAFRQAAELGLEPSGVRGHAWIIAYENSVKMRGQEFRVKQALLQPGYRGLIELALRSGEARKVEAWVVKEGDLFQVSGGDEPGIRHQISIEGWEARPAIAYYAVATLANGEKLRDWMTAEAVQKVRMRSKAPNSLMWAHYPHEGGRKTIVRRLLKYLRLSPEVEQALEIDDQGFPDEATSSRTPRALPVSKLLESSWTDSPPAPPAEEPAAPVKRRPGRPRKEVERDNPPDIPEAEGRIWDEPSPQAESKEAPEALGPVHVERLRAQVRMAAHKLTLDGADDRELPTEEEIDRATPEALGVYRETCDRMRATLAGEVNL